MALLFQMTEKGELLTVDGLPLGAKTMLNFAMYCLGKKVIDINITWWHAWGLPTEPILT